MCPDCGHVAYENPKIVVGSVVAEGDTVLLCDNVEEALAQNIAAEDLDPRLVHPYAISVIADHYGFKIGIKEKSDTRVVFLLTNPSPLPAQEETAQA